MSSPTVPMNPQLEQILSRPENSVCADCNASSPRWASVNLGVFICTNCAGVHRGIGTHITFVQSATIDEWKPEWVALADAVGNKVANEYYEYNVPSHIHKPDGKMFPNSGGGDRLDPDVARHLERWIRNKYELKLFADYSAKEPCVAFADGELVGPLGLPGPSNVNLTTTPIAAANGYVATPEKVSKKKKRSKKYEWSETTSEGASRLSWKEQAHVDVAQLDPRYLKLAPSQQGWQNNFFISSWISDVSSGHDHSRVTI
ncbi:centaurin/arf, putative [Perkinsus marinus ATCC 50983]|uniref:Centaurin/arf, putative n=1 Tax=Perkinsus marinus (strain ATCC 50983 / TXsc) TaxID=423536 RepID=C5K7V4_PERM5|nr:centaurin/arf, putative [Perkinsus marinus ATCC 50983]EER19639.1 centaurin/arf, putative [Perkinsus marinus ATCC 50983]|eukprot:XP_002787843.1 centaurin/arf, putative [Perkinsus marinus ATCC 50983]